MAAQVSTPDLASLQKKLHLRFRDTGLLERALTHSSYAHEHADQGLLDNERLEFLGDAVIELVAAQHLYVVEPDASEGALTLDRAAIVSTGALATVARRLDLGPYLRLGRGMERTGGRDLDSLLANAVEAVFGAVYLDRGFSAAARLFGRLSTGTDEGAVNHKGQLQELTQGESVGLPHYSVVEASGPAHHRHYRVAVRLSGVVLGEGEGPTRRAAEQEAAREAVQRFDTIRPGVD